MNKYKYFDITAKPKQLIFTCSADDILIADGIFQKETGVDPVKSRNVSCEIIFHGESE